MKNQEIIDIILSSPALPPTLASELVRILPTLTTEKVAWILCSLQQANEANKRYEAVALQVTQLLQANRVEIDRGVEKANDTVLAEVMGEFEGELDLLMGEEL